MNYQHYQEDNKLTWNDFVRIIDNAPDTNARGRIGVICGMNRINFEHIAKKYGTHINSWIYVVECESGESINIAEQYLEKCHTTEES